VEKYQIDAKIVLYSFIHHSRFRKTYMAKDVMLLFALMEVNLICQQHPHKQAGSPFWSSKKDQTDPEEEKPNTAI